MLRQIGRGGMGIVYEAEHVVLRKRVAIKLMLEKYANDPEAVARFQREAFAASRIGNPHIIDVNDIGMGPDGRSYVVMELLIGAPLQTRSRPRGRCELAGDPHHAAGAAARSVRRTRKGIVHRDLKPDNIFLVRSGRQSRLREVARLRHLEARRSRAQVAPTRSTTTGVVIGTPLYMAPEQAMGNDVDHRADIYACGVILYELLAGRPPFDGATYAVLVSKLLTQEPPPLASLRSGLPPALCKAVHRALQKEPHDRFATAEQFAMALPAERSPMIELAGTLDSGEVLATPRPTVKTSWPWLAIAAAGLVGVAAAGVFVVLRKDDPAASGTAQPQPEPPPKAVAAPPAAAPVTTGTIEVKSNPVGASVRIDNTPMGVTPIIVTLPNGPHHLHVELAGHTTIDADEEVRAGERSSVVMALPPSPSPTRPAAGTAATVAHPKVGRPNIKPGVAPTPLPGRPPPPPLAPPPPPPVIKRDDPPATKPPPSGGGTKPNPY